MMIALSDFFVQGTKLQDNSGYWFMNVSEEPEFEKKYLEVRTKEQRILNDEVVQKLPSVPSGHFHGREWAMRKKSTKRVLDYVAQNPVERTLDIGTGNGWFSNHLARQHGGAVIGLDVNRLELEQAGRVFQRENLAFLMADLFDEHWKERIFGRIVINSAVQYFPSFEGLMNRLFFLLKPGGEVHILDSPFYPAKEVDAAKARTKKYYQDLGFGEMAAHYFHHSLEELEPFQVKWAYRPSKRWLPFGKSKDTPFPWLIIKRRTF